MSTNKPSSKRSFKNFLKTEENTSSSSSSFSTSKKKKNVQRRRPQEQQRQEQEQEQEQEQQERYEKKNYLGSKVSSSQSTPSSTSLSTIIALKMIDIPSKITENDIRQWFSDHNCIRKPDDIYIFYNLQAMDTIPGFAHLFYQFTKLEIQNNDHMIIIRDIINKISGLKWNNNIVKLHLFSNREQSQLINNFTPLNEMLKGRSKRLKLDNLHYSVTKLQINELFDYNNSLKEEEGEREREEEKKGNKNGKNKKNNNKQKKQQGIKNINIVENTEINDRMNNIRMSQSKNGYNKGCAIIDFNSTESAAEFFERWNNKKFIGDRLMKITFEMDLVHFKYSQNRKIISSSHNNKEFLKGITKSIVLKNLKYDCDEQDVKYNIDQYTATTTTTTTTNNNNNNNKKDEKNLSQQISSIRLRKNRFGLWPTEAFITMKTCEDALQMCQIMNYKIYSSDKCLLLMECCLIPDIDRESKKKKYQNVKKNKVMLKNLHWDCSVADLQSFLFPHLQNYKDTEVNLIFDTAGYFQNFAIITCSHAEKASLLVDKYNGKYCLGKPIEILYAE